MAKRLFDIVASAGGLIILSPVFVLVAIIIAMKDGLPILFIQERVGRNGKTFNCAKFRTMSTGTENVATHEVSTSAITPLGHVLRRTKIDELPQLWNVLKGEMSLVGPRPCLPNQQELISERNKHGVLSLRPGITGISQLDGIDMRDPQKLAISDARYVAQNNFWDDLKLIFQTVFGKAKA